MYNIDHRAWVCRGVGGVLAEIAFGELREERQSCEQQTEAGELERLEDTERRLEASIALLTGAPGEPTLHSEVRGVGGLEAGPRSTPR